MQQIDNAQSHIFENEQNQFLMEFMQHQSCPFCSRSFFRGKLAYHLKHCSSENPMIKSNKPTPRHYKNSLSAATSYERCSNCNSRIPSFLIQRHNQTCAKSIDTKKKKTNQTRDSILNPQASIQQTIFPKIKNYPSKDQPKPSKKPVLNLSGPKIIKIRDQLRCFRIAQQVQKIECKHCGRKFSEQASQRHIPICSLIKQKQRKQIAIVKSNTRRQKIKLQGLGKSYEVISNQYTPLTKQPTKSNSLSIDLLPKQQRLDKIIQKQQIEEKQKINQNLIGKINNELKVEQD